MTTAACGHQSPPGAKFCMECGAPLALVCAQCQHELPAAAKFCPECGTAAGASAPPAEPGIAPPGSAERTPRDYTPRHLADRILQSRSALEGERKQVTVLFCDVKGSMELAEQVEAEEWHGILDRFFQILTEGVHRFEGTVNQYTGDGIMALFGAPIALEDHPHRACIAALYLRNRLRAYADELRGTRGLNFSVRIGLNSGDVIVGKIGDDLRMDYTAQGHTVGLASRLEQLAEPGTILLSQQTAALVDGYYELEDLGATRLKGVSEPVSTYRLRGVGVLRTRLDRSRSRGFTRFVGRHDEMAILEAALERASDGDGQVIGVVAEAGAGKSRLCFEFAERARARGATVYEVQGVAHGAGIPFLPVRQLFRQFYGIQESDPPERAREKIAGRLLLLDESLRDVLPTVFDFLGVADASEPGLDLDPDARMQQLYGLARRVTQATSRREATVTLIEDLHWVDDASLQFLAHMIDAAPQGRLAMLLNFRPEFSAGWMQRSSYQQIPLQPLGREAVDELMLDLLGPDSSVRNLTALVRERTGGNPFFIEEVVQSLAESGALEGERGAYRLTRPIASVRVPDSVQALLAARIDRLAEPEKRVLQLAAVVGPEFDEPTLERAIDGPDDLGDRLRALCDAEFLYPRSIYPVAEYAFKHPLTVQVAYESQLVDVRTRSHAAVARAIEALHPDTLDEHAAVLAHHHEGAGEPLEAARWLERAARREAPGAADRHWRHLRVLLEDATSPEAARLGATACLQILSLAWRLSIDWDDVDSAFADGIELAERCGDAALLISLNTAYGGICNSIGELGKALRYVEPALALAEKHGDPVLLADVRLGHLSALFEMGRFAESIPVNERLIAEAPSGVSAFWNWDTRLYAELWLPYTRALCGELEYGLEEIGRLVRLSNERGEFEVARSCALYGSICAWLAGDTRAAEECARDTIALGSRGRSPMNESWAADVAAVAHMLGGRLDDARRVIEETPVQRNVPDVQRHWLLPAVMLEAGEPQAAERGARAAIEGPLRERNFSKVPAQLTLACALIRQGAREHDSEVEAILRAAEELVSITGARSLAPRLAEVRAERAHALGDEAGAKQCLREAHSLYLEVGAAPHAERLARELEA